MSDGPPPAKRAHITPRNSIAANDIQTPFQHLHQLGRLINQTGRGQKPIGNPTTPGEDASRPGVLLPSSGNRVTPRSGAFSTPGGSKTPNAPRSGGARSGLRKPTTPHGIRAQLQSQQLRRYAGATPARDRRRSGRTLRETPRDDLRMLSRVLAPATRPLATPRSAPGTSRRRRLSTPQVYEDGSPVPEPPRLSMSRGDLFDDESFHEAPPRLSVGLEDEQGNITGIEEGRRAAEGRISVGRPSVSFADFGMAFADDETEDGDEDVYGQMGQLISEVFDSEVGDNETTRNLKLMEANGDRSSLASGARPSLGTDVDGNTTFQFVFPDQTRSRLSIQPPNMESLVQDDESIAQTGPIGGFDDIPDIQIGGDSDDGVGDADGETDDEADLTTGNVNDYLGENPGYSTTRLDISSHEPTSLSRTGFKLQPVKQPKKILTSRHGIEYPSMPNAVVKKLATTFARSSGGNGKIGRDGIAALTEASDWFFEQMANDLAAYATHGKRKTIEESDVITLMKRQRQLNDHSTVFSVAQKHLPGELLQAVRMPAAPTHGKKRKRLAAITEEEED